MNRRAFRIVLGICLICAAAFAMWGWLKPYSWKSDPAAKGKVIGTQVIEDHSNYWVTVHIGILPGQTHDLQKPVRLILSGNQQKEPADTTFGGDSEKVMTDVWFKFWLSKTELSGPLSLRMNDGTLIVKSKQALPGLKLREQEYYTTDSW